MGPAGGNRLCNRSPGGLFPVPKRFTADMRCKHHRRPIGAHHIPERIPAIVQKKVGDGKLHANGTAKIHRRVTQR